MNKGVNREHKDRLFRFIFGSPENKEWLLSLYNAVNKSSHSNADDIKFTTIEDAVYMSMKNDVSFIILDNMNFYEQQSTYNPNMPMRFFEYASMVYSKYIDGPNGYNRYSRKLQKIPTPKFVCFYNGKDDIEDEQILKLSDAYDFDGDLEAKVRMLNINYGKNKELLNACKALNDYSFFVDQVRKYQKDMNLKDAVNEAVESLPEDSLIKPFLKANQAEVENMCITEYDEERTFKELQEEAKADGYEEGRAEGRAEGAINMLIELVKDGTLTLENAAKKVGLSNSEFKNKLNNFEA